MLEVRDPADVRSVVGEVPEMTAAEVAAAYWSARAGFGTWRRTGVLDRAAVLARYADLIRARLTDGATIVVRENGKTLAEATVEVTRTADFLDYYASFACQPWGELLSDARPGTQTSVRVEPIGVVLAEAGLPEGVLQVITGRNSEISAALLASPDAVTFTGSNQVGSYLRRTLAVLADADLDMAEVILGGSRPATGSLEYGCYVEPTLINVTPAQSLWREEVFGPVLAITTASGFYDAVRLANDTTFGLAAAVFTSSLSASATFIDLAEAFKEQGAPGIRFYTRIKTAAVRYQW